MPRVTLVGYYGFGNTGDEALLDAIVSTLHEAWQARTGGVEPLEIGVLSARPEETRRSYPLEAIPRFSPLQVLRQLRRSDLVLSGGGTLLQDKTSLRSLVYYAGIILLARHLGAPVMLYANGLGPLTSATGRRLARRALAACRLITLRDSQSLQDLRQLAPGLRTEVRVTADPAFALPAAPARQATELLEAIGLDPALPILGVALRPWRGVAGLLPALADALAAVTRETADPPLQVAFLPMHFPADLEVSREVRERLPGTLRTGLVERPLSPRLYKAVLGRMHVVLGMRLHALILAAAEGVPASGLVYDPKVEGFLTDAGLPVAARLAGGATLDVQTLKRVLRQLIDGRETLVRHLAGQRVEWQARARENARVALDLLQEASPRRPKG